MEKHINKFSSRIVSLYGKTILINTLILSKTSYLIKTLKIKYLKLITKYLSISAIIKEQNQFQEKNYS